jgi:hypothetical protein
MEMLGNNEDLGYFELPMKKLYEHPFKKHIITINCITMDIIEKTTKPDLFGTLKISVVYLPNHVGKLDIQIEKL